MGGTARRCPGNDHSPLWGEVCRRSDEPQFRVWKCQSLQGETRGTRVWRNRRKVGGAGERSGTCEEKRGPFDTARCLPGRPLPAGPPPSPFCARILPGPLPLHRLPLHSPEAGVPAIPTREEPTPDLRRSRPTTRTPEVESRRKRPSRVGGWGRGSAPVTPSTEPSQSPLLNGTQRRND